MSSLNVLLIIALYFALWTFSPSLFINSHISHFGVENNLILLQWNDLLDEQTAVSIIYLNFGKVFPTVSHNKTLNEADEVWGGWAVNEVDWKLAERLSPGWDDLQGQIYLEVSPV